MTTWKNLVLGAVPLAALAFVGCNETTTQDDVREARKDYAEKVDDVREAKRDADKDVNEEVREAEEARAKLNKTEADFRSEQFRTDYVTQAERRLEAIDASIKDLNDRASKLEGDAETRMKDAIDRADEKRDIADDRLKELKSADVEAWPVKRDDVEKAMADAEMEIQRAKGTS